MSKFKLSVLLVILTAFSTTAMAGHESVKRALEVPAGAVALHFVWYLDLEPVEPGPPEFVGYIGFIEGVDGPLFANPVLPLDEGESPISKDTAHFTVRVTVPLAIPASLPVPDKGLSALLYPPGAEFTIYFNRYPDSRNWNDPSSFEKGVPIAVFKESALLGTGASAASFNLFSSRLIKSRPIKFNGQRINFRKLVPNGVTVTNFGNGLLPPDYKVASGGGTAIAIGGKPRRDYHDDDSDD